MPPGPHETTFGTFKQVRLTEAECLRIQAICKDALAFLDRYIETPDPRRHPSFVEQAQASRAEIASIKEKTRW